MLGAKHVSNQNTEVLTPILCMISCMIVFQAAENAQLLSNLEVANTSLTEARSQHKYEHTHASKQHTGP